MCIGCALRYHLYKNALQSNCRLPIQPCKPSQQMGAAWCCAAAVLPRQPTTALSDRALATGPGLYWQGPAAKTLAERPLLVGQEPPSRFWCYSRFRSAHTTSVSQRDSWPLWCFCRRHRGPATIPHLGPVLVSPVSVHGVHWPTVALDIPTTHRPTAPSPELRSVFLRRSRADRPPCRGRPPRPRHPQPRRPQPTSRSRE